MTKEQYNSLAPYQKEAYDKWNKGNRPGLFAGWIFLIIDTILFIMKKPLIYRWEDKRVLAKAETQTGAFIAAPSAADKLNELNKMLNSGAITQEEFDEKKAELLESM